MPWVRLDDSFAEHPKVIGLSDAAFRTHVAALCYCNRQLTDGHVPPAIGNGCVEELVAAGLWEPNERGYVIHDYLEFQPSKEEVKAHQAELSRVRSEAGKRGADARWNGKNGKPDGKSDGKPVANAWQSDGPKPVPLREGSNEPSLARTRKDPLWDELEAIFGTVPPKTSAHGKRNKAVSDLRRFQATPDTVRRAHRQWASVYPGATCTDVALSTHYAQLLRPQSEEEAAAWNRKAELEALNARYEGSQDGP